MRSRAAFLIAWVPLLLAAACGKNPAFGLSAADADTGAPPDASTSTGLLELPTTTAATTTIVDTTSQLDVTGPGDATSTTTTAGETTTGESTTTTDEDSTDEDSSTGIITASSECPDSDSLVACYRFSSDAPQGQLIDESGNGLHGQLEFANITPSFANYGTGLDLQPNNVVQAKPSPKFSTQQFTVSLFVFVKQGQQSLQRKALLDKEGSYELFLHNSDAHCRIRDKMLQLDIAVPVVSEVWNHLACTYDGETLAIHVHTDGVKPKTMPLGYQGGLGTDMAKPFVIGRSPGDPLTAYAGPIDHVLVFSEALAPAHLCQLAGPLCS